MLPTIRNLSISLNLLFILLSFIACRSGGNRLNVDVGNVDIDPVKINRYEQKLFEIEPNQLAVELKKIQPEFGIFLNGDLDDSLNLLPLINYIEDTLLQNLNVDCQRTFPDLGDLELSLTSAFTYYSYYYPTNKLPLVYTYVSGLDYEYPAQLMDNNMLIAIDMYLGKDYYRYKKLGLPLYMLNRFDKVYIVRDCMKEMAKRTLDYKKAGSALLDMIVNEGKLIYYTNAMIPSINDSVLLNYTATQMDWANNAEGAVWAFLLENEMLYSKENQPMQKFILESPFTSYFGADSPPRLGWYIGWRIVTAYMQNNQDVELQDLMNDYDAQKILQLSGYKPGI